MRLFFFAIWKIRFLDGGLILFQKLNRGYRHAFPLTFLRCIVVGFSRGPPFSFPFTRMDSVRAETNLIFRNRTVVPNITMAVTTLIQALNDSTVFLDIVPSTITAETLIVQLLS
ncbi:hypothetical protein SKAU_G00392850 [Synaphobranchus kaupii]|uniref:Secreted protein n=1 Tax=Synaphobranchus kaupii TaxID=118154 RepID=A0A9Q1EBU9_SYNKA|nr:hypothetical protein SKAU_G00392850 [Synaphobranchus kaupii]